jgi:hypothetical protein
MKAWADIYLTYAVRYYYLSEDTEAKMGLRTVAFLFWTVQKNEGTLWRSWLRHFAKAEGCGIDSRWYHWFFSLT